MSQTQTAAPATTTPIALSSHRPETVGGGSCGARTLLHACSNAEEDSGVVGRGLGLLRGMGRLIVESRRHAACLHPNPRRR